MRVTADWDDLMAALFAAGAPHGWVILTVHPSTPTEQRFEMLSVTEDPGWVIATREPPESEDDPGESIPLEVTANLGFFGDPAAEATLLEALRQRLIDLRGDGAVPLR